MALKYSSSNAHGFPAAKLILSKADVSSTQKWLKKQCEELVKRADNLLDETAERATDWAQEHYDEAYYAGEHDVLVRHEVNKRHQHVIIAEGDNLPFIEFGTGTGHDPWYFSTKDKDPTTRSGVLKGGVYAYRRGPRLDDPKKTFKLNQKAESKGFSERILENPKTGHQFTYSEIEKGLFNKYPEKEAKKRLEHLVKTWKTVSDKPQDKRFKKYKAQYGKPEQTEDAVRTYGNPPHHYMSRAFEEVTDQIDREIGRL